MVTELAILNLRSGASAAFEAAFASVTCILAGATGYRKHRLVPVIDRRDVYLLEVEWCDLSAHVDQFEPSAAHTRFMAALTPFLGAEPFVIHVPGTASHASTSVFMPNSITPAIRSVDAPRPRDAPEPNMLIDPTLTEDN